jgi:hypothetical protein
MRGIKITNEYSRVLGPLYERMPKAVLAAVAVSFAHRMSGGFDAVPSTVMDEWQTLFDNGLVTQKPSLEFRLKFAGISRSLMEETS